MTLHIVSKSPYSSGALHDCLHSFAEGDALLLIQDGVYAASDNGEPLPINPVYCLAADAEARGISPGGQVQVIDDTQWVDLCCTHNPIVSWFE